MLVRKYHCDTLSLCLIFFFSFVVFIGRIASDTLDRTLFFAAVFVRLDEAYKSRCLKKMKLIAAPKGINKLAIFSV